MGSQKPSTGFCSLASAAKRAGGEEEFHQNEVRRRAETLECLSGGVLRAPSSSALPKPICGVAARCTV